jgi:predicted GNAT family N-acyltransferase
MAIYTKIVTSDQEMDDALKVRREVFINEQHVPEDMEIDEHENICIHFVSYDEEQPVAAGRLRPIEEGGKVERICVLKNYRKHGLGLQLMQMIEEAAKDRNISKLILNSQTHAENFYVKLGYEPISEVFMDAGIPHVKMQKQLS